jgi:cyclopropane-fatty-acyl-phospholipid synthase
LAVTESPSEQANSTGPGVSKTSQPVPPAVTSAARQILESLVGTSPPVRIELWDGTTIGAPTDTRVVVRSPQALRRAVFRPGELGFARAYVAGDIDVHGDIFEALELRRAITSLRPTVELGRALATLVQAYGPRPPAPPPQEARLSGRVHSRNRDAAAISHHYDVPYDFYRQVLGPSMTYSCAVWRAPDVGLEAAQEAKHELVCRKLGLRPGMRLLDVGCGWGSLLQHAAHRHGVTGVGITLSQEQASAARRLVAEAGLGDRIEIRVQDYRAVADGPFDAVSSIGMVEHVGSAMLPTYFSQLYQLLRPGGRLLNHGISFPGDPVGAARPRTKLAGVPLPAGQDFLHLYVFPDGELHEIGQAVTTMQAAGFELRHVENLREHYGLTLRAWVSNLERAWPAAAAVAGDARARVWRLYMAGSALSFEAGQSQVHQVLGVRPAAGNAGMPLRPVFETV